MLSRTYQLASQGRKENATIDPNNELLWKFNRQRLDAETIRDSILMVSGELDRSRGGEHPFPHESGWGFSQHRPFTAVYDNKHRSVYLMTQRIQRHPYLSVFDGADTNASTPERSSSVTPLQALFMLNSKFMHAQSDQFAVRLSKATSDSAEQIMMAYSLAVGRMPSTEEIQQSQQFLQQGREKLATTSKVPADQHAQKALASFLQALMSSSEFIYID